MLIERQGPLPIEVPVGHLTQGRYQLALAFTNADGSMGMHWNRPLPVIPPFDLPAPPPITRSEIGPDGLLRVNGKPFLSIMFYHNPMDLQKMAALRKDFGVTTAQTWGSGRIDRLVNNVDLVYKAGVYAWAVLFHDPVYDAKAKRWNTEKLTEAVNRLKNHPGLIGWDLIDEPDGHGVAPEEVRRAAALVRKLDPNHVIWVNLCRPSEFQNYAGISDLASVDHYVFPSGDLADMHRINGQIRATAPNKPLLSVLQTYGGAGRGMPTTAQLRAEMYMNICDGMTLFNYYSWSEGSDAFGFLRNNPELQS